MRRLLVTANVGPSSPILVTLMMEVLSSSKISVPTRATRRSIPEDGIRNAPLFAFVADVRDVPAIRWHRHYERSDHGSIETRVRTQQGTNSAQEQFTLIMHRKVSQSLTGGQHEQTSRRINTIHVEILYALFRRAHLLSNDASRYFSPLWDTYQ
jgi:hypothetical protein